MPLPSLHAQSIDGSLRSLGVEVLDLVQFYWHDYSVPRYVGAAPRLQVWLGLFWLKLSRDEVASASRERDWNRTSCREHCTSHSAASHSNRSLQWAVLSAMSLS